MAFFPAHKILFNFGAPGPLGAPWTTPVAGGSTLSITSANIVGFTAGGGGNALYDTYAAKQQTELQLAGPGMVITDTAVIYCRAASDLSVYVKVTLAYIGGQWKLHLEDSGGLSATALIPKLGGSPTSGDRIGLDCDGSTVTAYYYDAQDSSQQSWWSVVSGTTTVLGSGYTGVGLFGGTVTAKGARFGTGPTFDFPTTPVLDALTTNGPLDANWDTPLPSWAIDTAAISGGYVPSTFNGEAAAWNPTTFTGDFELYVTLKGTWNEDAGNALQIALAAEDASVFSLGTLTWSYAGNNVWYVVGVDEGVDVENYVISGPAGPLTGDPVDGEMFGIVQYGTTLSLFYFTGGVWHGLGNVICTVKTAQNLFFFMVNNVGGWGINGFAGGIPGSGPPPSPPTVTMFTPISGTPGTSVSIVGTGFTGASAVTFGGADSLLFTVVDDSHITALVPVGAMTGPICVTTSDGTGCSAADFTVLPAVRRFSEGFQWRFLFTDLDVVTTTMPEDLLTSRMVTKSLNQSTVIEMSVWPDDFRVNGLFTDGYPRIAQSNRLVFGFRREGGVPPWRIRAAGIIMAPEDTGSTDLPVSHIAAYDPWKLLEARPAMNTDGTLPGPAGMSFVAAGDTIAATLLKSTILNEGGVFIDAGVAYGGTASWGGTIETTPTIALNVQQGQTVADVWGQLCQGGNCDIVLTPIYDPSRTITITVHGESITYHFTHELSIYNLAGSDKHNALFAWNRLVNNLTAIDRMHDATPGSFMDVVWYGSGQGGPLVPVTNPLTNDAAISVFGRYWSTQWYPSLTEAGFDATVYALAKQALVMAKQGLRTMTITPIADLAPVPIRDYDVGDRVPIYASAALRVTADGLQRVQTMPLQIDDNGVETVAGLICSPDWREPFS